MLLSMDVQNIAIFLEFKNNLPFLLIHRLSKGSSAVIRENKGKE